MVSGGKYRSRGINELLLLSRENVKDYLISKGLVSAGLDSHVEELGGGISNVLIKVQHQGGCLILKQSLPKLRVKDEWASELDRIFVEKDCIETLRKFVGEEHVPHVYFVDQENYLFAMSCVPEDWALWKKLLLVGEIDTSVASRAARLLARIHNVSAENMELLERFKSKRIFVQLRVDPYLWTTARRCPDVGPEINREAQRLLNINATLVHGDYSPKNIFVKNDKIMLLDFEVAHIGDPAFDTGFCLNHLFLKAVRNPNWKDRYFECAQTFLDRYLAEANFEYPEDLTPSTIRLLGCLMLARIDGKSPVEYITHEGAKNTVRRLSRRMILSETRTMEDLITNAKAEIESMRGLGEVSSP